jgi:cytochrome bd-type quinol oxidase subunit 2
MSLEMFKSVLTTVVLALALGQALGMAQVRGYVRLVPLERKRLRQWHRWGGIAVLVLTVMVAVMCVFGIGGRYASYSPRVLAHLHLGALAIVVLLVKVAIARRFRRYLRFTLVLGAAAGLLILGTFVASALWYFVQVA